MDGSSSSHGDRFEKATDVFQAATHSMKTAFPSSNSNAQTASASQAPSQGQIPEQQAGASTSRGAQQIDMVQPSRFGDDPLKLSAEEEKLQKTREALHQKMHTQNYFYPVFEAKPKQIEREREETYKAKQEKVVEEGKQKEFEKAKQSDDVFSRQQRMRKEGEGMKIGG